MADLNAEYTKRNAEIAARLNAGESRKSVADAFGLTKERIKQIHATVKRRELGKARRMEKIDDEMSVDLLEISIPTARFLRDIKTVGEIRKLTDEELVERTGMGRKALYEIREITGSPQLNK